MTRKTVRCPNCNKENAYDGDVGRVINCISCCYDETIPPETEAAVVGVEEVEVEEVVKVTKKVDVIETRIVKDGKVIKRGCTFEVDDNGKVVRVVSNG